MSQMVYVVQETFQDFLRFSLKLQYIYNIFLIRFFIILDDVRKNTLSGKHGF